MRFILIFTLLSLCLCNEKDQRVRCDCSIVIFVVSSWRQVLRLDESSIDYVVQLNLKIGPYHNPHETYDYFSLPFCRPALPDKFKTKVLMISFYDNFIRREVFLRFLKEQVFRILVLNSHS